MQICIQPRPLILGMPPPWSLTINYPVPSNIDEMSILGTLQKKGARKEGRKNSFARKEKNLNQETLGFESLSCSR
jgi:hypothetical protein